VLRGNKSIVTPVMLRGARTYSRKKADAAAAAATNKHLPFWWQTFHPLPEGIIGINMPLPHAL
jgi:hypothetical protein